MCSSRDAQAAIFFTELCSINAGETSIGLGLRLISKELHLSAIQTKIELHFGGFFHHMKVRQPIGRQDSMQTVIRTSRRLDSFLHEPAQNFELLLNIQDQK
jgi:hypothetical protein